MREVTFVKQHEARWKQIEQQGTSSRDRVDPDELVEQFIDLTDDLSYARTFYPGSNLTHYLNDLAATRYRGLMRNRREELGRFASFWTHELPALFYQSHRLLLISFLIFLTACVTGWVSAAHDPTFVRLIMGDEYVNMTLENIKKGNPLGVYGSGNSSDMFLRITLNNIRVSFLAFVAGIVASVGTILLLFSNGVMLGAFQEFFYERDLLVTSVLKIWIHGTLEIAAIVIAGSAGLTIGNSILFPGTYARLESFKRGARQGMKIVIGLVPVFIMAGFLESFVTRQLLPPAISGLIIAMSAAFIGWYFVLYPIQLNRKNNVGPPATYND